MTMITGNEQNDQLLGAHQDLVNELAQWVQKSARERGENNHRCVILEAPSGTGKTRILRELFERLRVSGQTENPYWPTLGKVNRVDGALGIDPMPQRKVLAPDPREFTWPADSMPEFAWWSFNCEMLASGDGNDFISAGTDQLRAHAIPLEIRLNHTEKAFTRNMARIGGALRRHVAEFASGTAEDQALEALGRLVPVPGLRELLGLANIGTKEARRWWSFRKATKNTVETGDEVQEDRKKRALLLADSLTALSGPGLPSVIVIEDIHRMTEEFGIFLSHLLSVSGDINHPVFIIGTAWPEASSPTYRTWLQTREDIKEQTVPALRVDELVEIVLVHAPRTQPAIAQKLAEELSTPYALKLWLTIRQVQAEIDEANGEITIDSFKRLSDQIPRTVEAVYKSRWTELNTSTKEALLLGYLSDSAGTENDSTISYIPELCVNAAMHSDATALSGGFNTAVSPTGWAMRHGRIDSLREEAMARCVREALKAGELQLTHGQQEAFKRELVSAAGALLGGVDFSDESMGVDATAARLTLDSQLDGDPETQESITARILLANRHMEDDSPTEAIDLLQPLFRLEDHELAHVSWQAMHLLAHACSSYAELLFDFATNNSDANERNEYLSDAISWREGAVTAAQEAELIFQSLGGDPSADEAVYLHDDIFNFRLDAATDSAEVNRALTQYDQYVAQRYDEVDLEANTLVSILQRYGKRRMQFTDRLQAIPIFERAYYFAANHFGDLSSHTLAAGMSLVEAVGLDGKQQDFLPLVTSLYGVALEEFGETDNRTIELGRKMLRWELKNTPSLDLAKRFDALLDHAQKTLGSYSSTSVQIAAERAEAWARAGEPDIGRAAIRAMTAELTERFGIKHPLTRYALWMQKYRIDAFARYTAAFDAGSLELVNSGNSRGIPSAERVREIRSLYEGTFERKPTKR